jgi:hypothetical protein
MASNKRLRAFAKTVLPSSAFQKLTAVSNLADPIAEKQTGWEGIRG